jgi:hypothetical protein
MKIKTEIFIFYKTKKKFQGRNMKLFVLFFVLSLALIQGSAAESKRVDSKHPIISGDILGDILVIKKPIQAIINLDDLKNVVVWPHIGTRFYYYKGKENMLYPGILDDKTFKAVLNRVKLDHAKVKKPIRNNNNTLKYEDYDSKIIRVHSRIPFDKIMPSEKGMKIYSFAYDKYQGREYKIIRDILSIDGISDIIVGLDAYQMIVTKGMLFSLEEISSKLNAVLIPRFNNRRYKSIYQRTIGFLGI